MFRPAQSDVQLKLLNVSFAARDLNLQDLWSSYELTKLDYLNMQENSAEHAAWLLSLIMSGAWYLIVNLKYLCYFVWPTDCMFSALDKVPRFVIESFPSIFMVALLEGSIRTLQGRGLKFNESLASISSGFFQECLRIKVRSIEVLMYCLVWENFRLTALPWNSLWTWWLCYLAVDFGFYWAHRIAHEVNFVWAIHQAHHSSEEFTVISALRQAALQPFTAWFTYVPLALVIPPQIFLAHLQLSELYMLWIHTEVVDSIGPLEYILNTPSHHRVHHSRNPEYIDKNYGGMLIIWDRLFGTFKAEDKSNPPVYGLVHPVRSFNPIYLQLHTWPVIWRRLKRSSGIKNKLGVLLMGPGWRPGLDRLGDPNELPKIDRSANCYNPIISAWRNAYILVHFFLLLLFYRELTFSHDSFSPVLLNIGVISIIASITCFGMMLDSKKPSNVVYELIRCLLFFPARISIVSILDHGMIRCGILKQYRVLAIGLIYLLFLISVMVNSTSLVMALVKSHLKSEKLIQSAISAFNQLVRQKTVKYED